MDKQAIFFPDQFAIISRSCCGGSSLHEGLMDHFRGNSFRSVSGGAIMRRWAEQRKMKIGEFAAYNENHPEEENDYKMDQFINIWASQRAGVYDGRIPLRYAVPGAFQVSLVCAVGIRAKRRAIQENKEHAVATVEEELIDRDGADDRRYLRLYGQDVLDEKRFHLSINTGVYDKAQTLRMTLEAHAQWLKTMRSEGRITEAIHVPEFIVEMRKIKDIH